MTNDSWTTGLELRSTVEPTGSVVLSLERVPIGEPSADEVLIRVEAAPINPSDLRLLLAGGDFQNAARSGTRDNPVTTALLPPELLATMKARLGESMTVGNEGAGLVVAAGTSAGAQALLGKTEAVIGGSMYSQFRVAKAVQCYPLPAGVTAAEGASIFVNPLTALGMVETMRREGHTALVHTVAASNLGQMLNRICIKDGIGLVNIVRSESQAAMLRAAGAVHVCDSSRQGFTDDLYTALAATGATIAFDAIGGGRLAGQILTGMEAAINASATEYSRYGSSVHKQVYIYGALDTGPTVFDRSFGLYWGVCGWLLTPFIQKVGAAEVERLQSRVVSEIKTTFASHYTRVVSLAEALDPAIIVAYSRRATGEKYLIDPTRDVAG